MADLIKEDWWIDHDGQSVVLDSDKVRAELHRLRTGLHQAAYALFQIKRMQPDTIVQFVKDEHAKACAVLDDEQ